MTFFSHRQVGEKGIVLEDHAHAAVFRRNPVTVTRNRRVADANRPLIRSFEPSDESQGCGLTTSAGAQQSEDLALADIERYVGQGLNGPRPITLAHIFQINYRHIGERE